MQTKIFQHSLFFFSLIFSLMNTMSVQALEIDEKLTFRVLKVSDTGSTILINRGIEDGIAVGDHSKWFITTGVVARGVVVKAAPTRSVWSLYKKIDKEYIKNDMVLNMKITPPVKLSTDPSKVFADSVNAGREHDWDKIPLAENANDLEKPLELPNMSDDDRRELESIYAKSTAQISLDDRLWEVWGTFHVGSMTAQNSADIDDYEETQGNQTAIDLTVGLEKYFEDYDTWYGAFSLYPLLHLTKHDSINIDGVSTSASVVEFGAGLRYHFLQPPNLTGGIGVFVGGNLGVGMCRESRENRTSSLEQPTVQGSTSFLSVEGGLSYYWMNGIGIRGIVDWYRRVENYEAEAYQGGELIRTRTIHGPRVAVGISYRF